MNATTLGAAGSLGHSYGASHVTDPARVAQNGPGNPVPTALGSMDKASAYLHDRLSLLEQRLAPVLAPVPPTPVGNEAGKLARHSLAMMIESSAANTLEAAQRIDSIINRLEL